MARHVGAHRGVWVLFFLLAGAPWATGDVFVLVNGDRITGKTQYKGTRSFNVETEFGRLTIPRAKIERIVHDDGSEEVLNRLTSPLQLILVITGKTFWYAWDPPRGGSVDPRLRLEVTLDEESVAVYTDPKLDPQDIPGALVNSFNFAGGDVVATPGKGVQVQIPEVRPGRISLKIELPPDRAGPHKLRLAYQLNAGPETEPAWRDVVGAGADVELKADAPTFVQLQQDAGQMEFSGLFGRKRMKHVETFRLQARSE